MLPLCPSVGWEHVGLHNLSCTLRGAIRTFNFPAACGNECRSQPLAGGETEATGLTPAPRSVFISQAAVGRQLKQQTFLSPSLGLEVQDLAQVGSFPGESLVLVCGRQPLTVSTRVAGRCREGRCTDVSSYWPLTLSDQGPTS